jgi:hypothetical protein
MKKLFVSFLIFILSHSLVSAQELKKASGPENKIACIEKDEVGVNFQYMTGSNEMPGYEIKVYYFSNEKIKPLKTFSNGKSAPILQIYVNNKSKYIGGILESEKGTKTTIKNITLVENGNTLLFTVVGKDFSMSFILENGCLLKEDDNTVVFNTEKVGIWKMNKKK